MAEIKTKATKESVTKFLKSIQPKEKQVDSLTLLNLFKKITGEKPVMWGTSIVGFGKYHYKSEKSAQEGDWFHVGFSPRKQNLTLYILAWKMEDPKLLAKLGKYKKGGGCLYINRLSDVDEKILAKLIKEIYIYRKKIHKKEERLRDAKDISGS
jgi:hypothetical protein